MPVQEREGADLLSYLYATQLRERVPGRIPLRHLLLHSVRPSAHLQQRQHLLHGGHVLCATGTEGVQSTWLGQVPPAVPAQLLRSQLLGQWLLLPAGLQQLPAGQRAGGELQQVLSQQEYCRDKRLFPGVGLLWKHQECIRGIDRVLV